MGPRRRIYRGLTLLLTLGLLSGVLSSASGAPPGHQVSVEELGYLPGELIVKFTEAAVKSLAGDPRGDLTPSAWPSLSQLNRRYRVEAVERVFPTVANTALDQRYGLSRTYRLRVPPGTDVWAMARDYAALSGVAYAEPNRLAWFTQDVTESNVPPNDPDF